MAHRNTPGLTDEVVSQYVEQTMRAITELARKNKLGPTEVVALQLYVSGVALGLFCVPIKADDISNDVLNPLLIGYRAGSPSGVFGGNA